MSAEPPVDDGATGPAGVELPGVEEAGVELPGVAEAGVEEAGAQPRVPELTGPELTGPDLARAALARARASARDRGLSPGAPRRRRPAPSASGSGPDGRDPVLLGATLKRLVAERGWEQTTTAAGVLANWDRLVGSGIAEHCRPAALTDGVLELVAESSAWATQLRLMTRTLTARLTEQVGEGVVASVVVRGPTQPDWRKGSRRVQGRGPRDTYG